MSSIDTMFTFLMKDNPFFGFLLNQFKLVEKNDQPTMGVTIQNKKPILVYNADFVKSMSVEKSVGVLEHECLHILFKHINRQTGMHKECANIAMDMEINQMIKWMIEEKRSNKEFEYCWPVDKWAPDKQFEYYYNKLLENQKQINITIGTPGEGEDGEGEGSGGKKDESGNASDKKGKGKSGKDENPNGKLIDNHDGWEDMDDSTKEQLGDMVKEAIKAARTRGQDLGQYSDIISNFFKVKENWEQMLKKWVSNRVKTSHKFKLRPDRRRKTIPARVKGLGTEVVIGFDSSGSCMNDFGLFANQIKRIYETQKKQSSFWIATCDMKVEVQKFNGKNLKLSGGGGTDMRVLINEIYTNKHLIQNNRLVILFTDGETPWFDSAPYPNMKLLVVYTTEHSKMSGDGAWFKSIVIKP